MVTRYGLPPQHILYVAQVFEHNPPHGAPGVRLLIKPQAAGLVPLLGVKPGPLVYLGTSIIPQSHYIRLLKLLFAVCPNGCLDKLSRNKSDTEDNRKDTPVLMHNMLKCIGFCIEMLVKSKQSGVI